MRPHQGRIPEGDVVAGHDQGPLSGNTLQTLHVEVEERPGEEPREPAPEGVDGPDRPRGLHRQGGPSGGQVHLFFGPDVGGIEKNRVRGADERARGPLGVAAVPLTDLLEDRIPVRVLPFTPELEESPLGARLSGRGDEDLEISVWKNHRADVASFHHETRLAREGALDGNEPPTKPGMERHPGGGLPRLGGADRALDRKAVHRHAARAGRHSSALQHGQERRLNVEGNSVPEREPGDGPVHGSRVDVQEPETLRNAAGSRALPRPRRPVDREDERLQRKRPRRRLRNPGSETRADSAPSTVTPSRAASPATMNAIAIRWSPAASTVPPRTRPAFPWIVHPSGCSSTSMPIARSPAATVATRSDSFTRSSSAPWTTVVPSANAASTATSGSSSMSLGAASGTMRAPRSFPAWTRRSETGSPETIRSFPRSSPDPIPARCSRKAMRVGFTPTPLRRTSEPRTIEAAASRNEAAEKSPGTSISAAFSSAGPRTRAAMPSRSTGTPKRGS